MNVRYFPMDRQECHFTFLSWSYDATLLDLNSPSVRLDMGRFAFNIRFALAILLSFYSSTKMLTILKLFVDDHSLQLLLVELTGTAI